MKAEKDEKELQMKTEQLEFEEQERKGKTGIGKGNAWNGKGI